MPEVNGKPAEYCGDGVYAIFDGYGIWLHANSHDNPTDRIYLEPGVLDSIVMFYKQCVRKAELNGGD